MQKQPGSATTGTTREIRKKRGKQRNLRQEKDRSTSMMGGNEENYGTMKNAEVFGQPVVIQILQNLTDPASQDTKTKGEEILSYSTNSYFVISLVGLGKGVT
jgi:hypothetical protein